MRTATPASRTDGETMNVRRSFDAFGLFHLPDKIQRITGTGRCHIRNVVGNHYFSHILFPGFLPGTDFSRWSGGGGSAHRSPAGTLNAWFHVGFVVEADLNHIVASFHRAGKSLKPDVH